MWNMLNFPEKYVKTKNPSKPFFGRNGNMNVPLLDEVEVKTTDSKISRNWTSKQLTQHTISKVSLFVFAQDTQPFSSYLDLSKKLSHAKRDSSLQISMRSYF